MGQYYHPINLTRKTYMYSHHYDNGLKLMEHSWVGNNFVNTFLVHNLIGHICSIVWSWDYADSEPETITDTDKEWQNLYSIIETVENPETITDPDPIYAVINMTRSEYVLIPKATDDYQIHPIPLLTCEGNNRWGWDFYTDGRNSGDYTLIGKWARNDLTAFRTKEDFDAFVSSVFTDTKLTEIIFDLKENW